MSCMVVPKLSAPRDAEDAAMKRARHSNRSIVIPAKERVKKLIWPAATPLCWSEKNPGQPETTAKLRWRPAFTTEKNRIFGPIFRVPILSQARKRASRGHQYRHRACDSWIPAFAGMTGRGIGPTELCPP